MKDRLCQYGWSNSFLGVRYLEGRYGASERNAAGSSLEAKKEIRFRDEDDNDDDGEDRSGKDDNMTREGESDEGRRAYGTAPLPDISTRS